jgi:prevent-host-death family protein
MREVASQNAPRGFSDLIARVRLNGERVLVTRFGKPAAMIVPVTDAPQLEPRPPPGRGRER